MGSELAGEFILSRIAGNLLRENIGMLLTEVPIFEMEGELPPSKEEGR